MVNNDTNVINMEFQGIAIGQSIVMACHIGPISGIMLQLHCFRMQCMVS